MCSAKSVALHGDKHPKFMIIRWIDVLWKTELSQEFVEVRSVSHPYKNLHH
jgi:hypothetical protein